ncbi:ESX secretion-associated protein EspG [Nocardia paucivorans]|uniref:ESX secretion-associated protein EspG n=1 Tax=Nocardia paucivorans TaxID=114259 RepID=UPI0002FF54D4|nr:ESX secretion-associated protein EspG [Nocardia paucivorans]
MNWTFTPDEFAHIWRETDLDRIPYPLRILETPRTDRDAEVLRAELDRRLPLGGDPDLSACLRILAAPHTRMVAIGETAGPSGEIRALACTVYDRAVLAVQEPGRTPDFGGSVRVSIGHSSRLGTRFTALLPAAPPGRQPSRTASATAVRDEETVVPTDPAAPRIRRLLRARHTARGHIRIETRLDRPIPPPPLHYTWLDVADDGRYLLRTDENVHMAPASAEQIANLLQKRIPS